MEQEKLKQTSEAFPLSAVLSLSGGFQDAYTYYTRGNVFANAQTGNVVLMSHHFMLREWQAGLRYFLPVIAFIIGIIVAEQIEHRSRKGHGLHWRQTVVLLQILALAVVAFLPLELNMLANILVSFSCSMQVQAFRTVRGFGYASTMCIGNLRSGTESLSAYFREKKRNALYKALHYFGIILIFALGAGIGGILSDILGIRAILISCLLLLIAFGMMYQEYL